MKSGMTMSIVRPGFLLSGSILVVELCAAWQEDVDRCVYQVKSSRLLSPCVCVWSCGLEGQQCERHHSLRQRHPPEGWWRTPGGVLHQLLLLLRCLHSPLLPPRSHPPRGAGVFFLAAAAQSSELSWWRRRRCRKKQSQFHCSWSGLGDVGNIFGLLTPFFRAAVMKQPWEGAVNIHPPNNSYRYASVLMW